MHAPRATSKRPIRQGKLPDRVHAAILADLPADVRHRVTVYRDAMFVRARDDRLGIDVYVFALGVDGAKAGGPAVSLWLGAPTTARLVPLNDAAATLSGCLLDPSAAELIASIPEDDTMAERYRRRVLRK